MPERRAQLPVRVVVHIYLVNCGSEAAGGNSEIMRNLLRLKIITAPALQI
ncbi:MAG: hypothetical protein ABJB21_06335 [bacterium]